MIGRFFFVSLFMALFCSSVLAAEPVKPAASGTPNTTVQAATVAAPAAQPVAATAAKPIEAPKVAVPALNKVRPNRGITIGMFGVIIAITLGVVVWAAKKTTTASDFYAAGGGVTGLQNGWAS